MTSLQSIERELLTHAAAMRSLARDLVGESAADDLVQETALRALLRPPAETAGLWPWLATILRRLASKRRRGERRRRRRERAAARAEAQPPAGAELERRDSLQWVTDAVLALSESYQTAIVQRYFEGWSPSAMASRSGIPLATVKSRLRRGLVLLRRELDRSERDWRGALLAATGLAPDPVVTVTGGLLVAPTAKLALAGSAAAVLGIAILLGLAGTPPGLPAAPSRPGRPPIVSGSAGTHREVAAKIERERVPPTAANTDVDLAHPYSFELRCRVVDRDGLPVEGAQLFLAPAACALNTWPQATDAEGRVTLQWRGRVAAMTMAVGVRRDDLNQLLQQVQVQAGTPRQLALLGEAPKALALADIASRGGQPASLGAATDHCKLDGSGLDCHGCHVGPQLRGVFDSRLRIRRGLHPEATFADLLLPGTKAGRAAKRAPGQSDNTSAPNAALLIGGFGKQRAGVDRHARDRLEAPRRGRRVARPPTGRIAGHVYGSDGAPAANETVIRGDDIRQPQNRTRSRADGTFAFESVPPGPVHLRCGGGDHGLAVTTVQVTANRETRTDLVLRLGAVLRGRALGPDGAPLARYRVEYVALGEPWTDACTTQEDGSFVLPNLPAAPGRLLLWPRRGTQLPIAVEPTVLPDGGDVVFDLRRRGPATGALRLRVLLPDGAAKVTAEARIWQGESDRGSAMEPAKDGSFVLGHLAAGFYRVEVGAAVTGWRDLGQVWVDGQDLCDLGSTTLPPPGRVRLHREPGLDGAFELYLRRPDGDVRAEDVATAAGGGDLLLPAGRWLCLWRTPENARGVTSFRATPGATTDVWLGAVVTGSVR